MFVLIKVVGNAAKYLFLKRRAVAAAVALGTFGASNACVGNSCKLTVQVNDLLVCTRSHMGARRHRVRTHCLKSLGRLNRLWHLLLHTLRLLGRNHPDALAWSTFIWLFIGRASLKLLINATVNSIKPRVRESWCKVVLFSISSVREERHSIELIGEETLLRACQLLCFNLELFFIQFVIHHVFEEVNVWISLSCRYSSSSKRCTAKNRWVGLRLLTIVLRSWPLLLVTWLLIHDFLSYLQVLVQANFIYILYLKRSFKFFLTVSTKTTSNSCLKWAKSSFVTTSTIWFGLHELRFLLIQSEVAHKLLGRLRSAGAFVVANLLVVLWALVGWAETSCLIWCSLRALLTSFEGVWVLIPLSIGEATRAWRISP